MSDKLWFRIGALISISIGFFDNYAGHHFGDPGDIAFIVAGLSALGVHTIYAVPKE